MVTRWSLSEVRRRVVPLASAVGAFSLVYLAGKAWLANLLTTIGAVAAFQLGRDMVGQIQDVGAFGLAVAAAGAALRLTTRIRDRAASRRPGPRDDIDDQAAALSRQALLRSRSHPLRHKLNRPLPLRVWYTQDGSVSPGQGGSIEHLAELLRGLEQRRLVILGGPGAGKSTFALLLTHRMLAHPEPGEAMPLLLPISSWNPETETVGDFIVRRLEEDYGVGRALGRRLLVEPRPQARGHDGFWLMPVLDGLDELPAELHLKAIAALESFAAADHPFVLTSRTQEYRQAPSKIGALSRVATITLAEARLEDAIEFLTQPEGAASPWATVLEPLRDTPGHPLSRVLSTPLMISLAREAYTDRQRNPDELLSMQTQRQISNTLFARYLANAYRTHGKGLRRYEPADAMRWLGTLAHHLYQAGTRDLHWWTIPLDLLAARSAWWVKAGWVGALAATGGSVAAMPGILGGRPLDALLAGAVAALLAALTFGGFFDLAFPHAYDRDRLMSRPTTGFWIGVRDNGDGLTSRDRILFRIAIRHLDGRFDGIELDGRTTQRAVWGAACGLVVGGIAHSPLAGLIAGVISVAASSLLPAPKPRPTAVRPERTLLSCHRYAALTAVRHGLAAAVAYAVVGVALRIDFAGPWLVAAVTVHGLAAALASGTGTWIVFRMAVLRLALQGFPRRHRGLLPARLVSFLRDGAHELRSTMRHNGGAWQFRHALIQVYTYDRFFYARQRRLAEAGDTRALWQLVSFLWEQGDSAELRRMADAGDREASLCLAELLREQGRPGEAVALLRPWHEADAGDEPVAAELVQALREAGELEEALAVLRRMMDLGNEPAADYLADLLCYLRRWDELRRLADTGRVERANDHLARMLRRTGGTDELMARSARGDWQAARELADHLFEKGDLGAEAEFLSRLAEKESRWARNALADVLYERGSFDEATALLRYAVDEDGDIFAAAELLARMLRERGEVEELRRRAESGDLDCVTELERALRERGEFEELAGILRRIDDTGSSRYAHERLLLVLKELGRVDELRDLARSGDMPAVDQLTSLLREDGKPVDEAVEILRNLATKYFHVHRRLAELLREEGRLEEARVVLEATGTSGVGFDSRLYAQILYELGDLEALRRWADAGTAATGSFAELLAEALSERGELDEAIAVLRRSKFEVRRGAKQSLTQLLREAGYADELRGLARLGWWQAAKQYAVLLKERGELGKANLSGYRGRAENGDAKAAIQLVFLLSEMGRLEEAMAVLALPLGHESLASEVFHHLLAEESYALPAPLGRRRRTGYEWAEGLDDAYVKYKIRVMNTL